MFSFFYASKAVFAWVFLLLALTAVSAISARADYLEGFTAYERGDYAAALKEFRSLAEQGDAYAQNMLGLFYRFGLSIPRDTKEAAKWYRKAAEQGVPKAQESLGSMYIIGEGVSKDDKEAAKWYRKAAEQGHKGAQLQLGLLYAQGQGVPHVQRQLELLGHDN